MATTTTDIRVPADQFPLGRIPQEYPDVEGELERIIPTSGTVIPLFWVDSDGEDAVEGTLREDPLVEEVVQPTRTPDRVRYSVKFTFGDYRITVTTAGDVTVQRRSAARTNGGVMDEEAFQDALSDRIRAAEANGDDGGGGWTGREDSGVPGLGVERYEVER